VKRAEDQAAARTATAAAKRERIRQDRADVTKALLDDVGMKQLSSSGDEAWRRRGKQ
jgi:hypothetical protein